MELRTVVTVQDSGTKISHNTRVMFIGSCFASEIGQKCSAGKIPVMINPHGTLFNPVSVSLALRRFAEGYHYTKEDLYSYGSKYISLSHYTAFASEDSDALIKRLNEVNSSGYDFLRNSSFLFVTFGTAWLFSLSENNQPVANCHKLPSGLFSRRQAGVNEIIELWTETLDMLQKINPDLKVVFTISPVRHLNDGAHGNQLSKARLLLAVEELLQHPVVEAYFPAYEIFMDDLRDYRFYSSDLIHPSDTGIEYVWEQFTRTFFTAETLSLWREAEKINRAMQHRLTADNQESRLFAGSMLSKIETIRKSAPYIDMDNETAYFNSLIK